MKKHHVVLLALVCTLPSSAWAQWQWLDKDGRKVFSDRAPPLEIPQRNILKQPSSQEKPLAPPEKNTEEATSTPTPAPTASPTPAGIDKELQARKAQADAAEAAKKKAEEARLASTKAENCSRAHSAKANLNSGQLLRHTNAQGENVIMNEATRSAELQRLQTVIDTDCRR